MSPLEEDGGSAQPPRHPVPQLQGPFEESMMESLNELEEGEQKTDSIARRKMLLQGERYERVCAGRWKQRPGEKFHPLWKLSAQLSFGLHLLAQGMAKSEEEVMRILQSHVDDIDGFLERTTEDFDLAQSDVEERLRYLRLPLEHVEVFDHMLDDRTFRSSIVEGNEKIEHIVERTSEAMKDALKDVQKGIDATGALGKYLTELKSKWTDRTPELDAVYVAMLGNVEGWTRAFMDLHLQGNRLAVSLVQLAGIVAEMQRRAGIASRKVLLPYSGPANGDVSRGKRGTVTRKQQPQSPGLTASRSPQPSPKIPPNKPLPVAPDLMVPARQASRAKLAHEEKLRRRSLDVLREQQEKTKGAQTQSDRKPSVAEKVRSVTRRGSAQAVVSHAKPSKASKQSDARFPAAPKSTTPALSTPKFIWSESAIRSSAQPGLREPPHREVSAAQPGSAIELPAEVPLEGTVTYETPKKGGLDIHLGSKHKNKEHGSAPSSLKSLNIFRKSSQSAQVPETTTESEPAEATTLSPVPANASPSAEGTRQTENQLSPPSVSPPRRSSPDPGLPTPPALIPTKEPSPYTALPDVLATAQRATTVRASLKISVSASGSPEPERTPRAIPSQPPEAIHTQVTLTELASDASKPQATSENKSKRTSYDSSHGGRGPQLPVLDTTKASAQNLTPGQDDEITPTTNVRPHVSIPATSDIAAQEAKGEPLDTPLTSATMRSYSDFCKLPPHQTSPTPPPITPEESLANQSTASSEAPSASHSKSASIQEVAKEVEPSQTKPEEQPPPSRSSQRKPASPQKKSTNPKDLRIKPRNKDLQNQSELLDMIASTPPHSPIHRRTSSDGSALNAVSMKSSTSRVLAPPDEAPPPPAPGGRSMIIPNYAAAGAFEGERKAKPKRGSGTNPTGWKKMFAAAGGSTPTVNSPGNSTGVSGGTGAEIEDEKIQMSANLMSGEGNDVLWYKGMGRDGVWVSGA